MKYSTSLLGVATPVVKTLKIGATVAAGTVVIRDTNVYGHAIPCTTTASVDSMGLALTAATYTATPTALTEGTVEVVVSPFSVIRSRVAGSATSGAALSAATGHVLTQASASSTVVSDTDVLAASMNGGTLFGLTGANAGLSRVLTSHVDSTSVTLTVAMPNSIAVGDKVAVVPYSAGSAKIQPTTDLTEADATIAIGTGINGIVTDVELELPIDDVNPLIHVSFVLADMAWVPNN